MSILDKTKTSFASFLCTFIHETHEHESTFQIPSELTDRGWMNDVLTTTSDLYEVYIPTLKFTYEIFEDHVNVTLRTTTPKLNPDAVCDDIMFMINSSRAPAPAPAPAPAAPSVVECNLDSLTEINRRLEAANIALADLISRRTITASSVTIPPTQHASSVTIPTQRQRWFCW